MPKFFGRQRAPAPALVPATMQMDYQLAADVTRQQVKEGIKALRVYKQKPVKDEDVADLPQSKRRIYFHLQWDRANDESLGNIDKYIAHRKAKRQRLKWYERDAIVQHRHAHKLLSRAEQTRLAQAEQDEVAREKEAREQETELQERRNVDPSLGGLHANDHLYLVAHGNMGQAKLGGHHPLDQYSPEDVAKRIEASGLPKNHRVIKLFACWGAVTMTPVDPSKQPQAPFAHRLALALANLGYRDLLVFGYSGSVDAPVHSATNSSEGRKTVSFVYEVDAEKSPELAQNIIAQATANDLTRIDKSEFTYLRNVPVREWKTSYGHDADTNTVVRKHGWNYRGVYITDPLGNPWVIVIPWPPENYYDSSQDS